MVRDLSAWKTDGNWSSPVLTVSLCPSLLDSVLEWRGVDERVVLVQLRLKNTIVKIIRVYAPNKEGSYWTFAWRVDYQSWIPSSNTRAPTHTRGIRQDRWLHSHHSSTSKWPQIIPGRQHPTSLHEQPTTWKKDGDALTLTPPPRHAASVVHSLKHFHACLWDDGSMCNYSTFSVESTIGSLSLRGFTFRPNSITLQRPTHLDGWLVLNEATISSPADKTVDPIVNCHESAMIHHNYSHL